ncbi:MAG TPA: response regulator [Bryobacteraceae bacterium]|nr:response regulator [Bryobacteraceae bacterium]
MSATDLRVLLVEDNAVSAQLVKMMLGRADTPRFEVRTADTLRGALDLLGPGGFDVVLLDLSLPDSDGLGTLTTIRVHTPHVPVLVLTGSDNETLANAALQHGAQDYIVKGQFDANSLARALRYAVTRHKQAADNPADEANAPRGTVIGVIGAKGGVGGSTVATHLALETRRLTGQEVLLVDLDVSGGTVGFLMKVEHSYTVLDASLNLHRLDAALWQSFVKKHSSGLDVLQSPGSARFGEQLRDEPVRHLLRLAQSRYTWVVIDMGRFNELSINLLGETNKLLLVTTGDIPSLYEAKRIVQKTSELGLDSSQLKLILNRASRADMDLPELERTFGMRISSFCPEARHEMHEAYAEGKLLPPGSALRKQIGLIAEDLTGIHALKTKSSVRTFLGLRRGA